MEEIIQYFAEVCYERFMEEQGKIFKNPKGFSDFEKGVTKAVNGLGRKFIRLTLEEMNRCFKDSSWRREKWYVEDTDRKQQIMFWRKGCGKKTALEKERSAGLQCGGTCVSCAVLQNEQSGDGMEQAWSSQMARLREYYHNGGDMLELARYQKAVITKAAGAEELELSAKAVLRSEMDRRSKMERETGKYMEAMTHTLSLQGRKKLSFNIHAYI